MTIKRHFHPLFIFTGFYRLGKAFLPVLISIFFFSHLSWWAVLLAFALATLFLLVNYWMTTYELTEDELIFRSGLIERKVRHLPYQKIQNLNRHQLFFLQPFHLEGIAVDSAGMGKDKQIDLTLVPTWVALVLEGKRQDARIPLADLVVSGQVGSDEDQPVTRTDAPKPSPLSLTKQQQLAGGLTTYRASIPSLILYSLTSFDVFLQFVALLLGLVHLDFNGFVGRFLGEYYQRVLGSGILVFVVLFILVLALLLLFTIIRTMILYFAFSVVPQDNHLTITRGLFERRTLHLATNRIQTVAIQQNLLRQLLGLATVTVKIITDQNGEDRISKKTPTLIPLTSLKTANHYLQEWITGLPGQPFRKVESSTYQILTMIRNGLCCVLPVIIFLLFFFHQLIIVLLATLIVALVIGAGWYKGKATSVQLVNQELLLMRSAHAYQQVTSYIPRDKIQSLSIRQSWWLSCRNQRAHLQVVVRTDNSADRLVCRYLPIEECRAILSWYQSDSDY